MRYRFLGKTGLEVSEVGFGCVSVGPRRRGLGIRRIVLGALFPLQVAPFPDNICCQRSFPKTPGLSAYPERLPSKKIF